MHIYVDESAIMLYYLNSYNLETMGEIGVTAIQPIFLVKAVCGFTHERAIDRGHHFEDTGKTG